MSFLWYNYNDDNYTNSIEGLVIEKYYMDYIEKPINELLEIARKEVFDFEYPFYTEDEEQKTKFEKMFILMYYQRGFANETVGGFKLNLLSRLTQYMPYYEELYKSMLFKIDPLNNKIYTIERNKNSTDNETENRVFIGNKNVTNKETENSNGNGNVNNSGKVISEVNENKENQNIDSENPQINFSGKDFANRMTRGKDVNSINTTDTTTNDSDSNYSETKNINTDTKHATEDNENLQNNKNKNENETEEIKGFEGSSQAEMIEKYRKIIVNINEDLCRNLEILFSIFQ